MKESDQHAASAVIGWTHSVRLWWERRHLVSQLGSEEDTIREAAMQSLSAPELSPLLYRALHGPILIACGAATTLYRCGQRSGIQTVLARCYEEEWLLRSVQVDQPGILKALRRLEREAIGQALHKALETAAQERRVEDSLSRLELATSALRVLLIFETPSPLCWWNRALGFGHHCLYGLRSDPFAGLANNLTDGIRALAMRGLFAEHTDHLYEILMEALHHADASVGKTALLGLHRLADRRSLPQLQVIAFTPGHPLAHQARRAVERIAGAKADALLLLRGAVPEDSPEELLRPTTPEAASREESRSLLHPSDADSIRN